MMHKVEVVLCAPVGSDGWETELPGTHRDGAGRDKGSRRGAANGTNFHIIFLWETFGTYLFLLLIEIPSVRLATHGKLIKLLGFELKNLHLGIQLRTDLLILIDDPLREPTSKLLHLADFW